MRPGVAAKRVFKFLGWAVAGILAYGILHGWLAYHPAPLFSDKESHGNLTVFMREEIPPEITGVLDRVRSLLATSELDDPELEHRIYIFNSRRLVTFLLTRDPQFGASLPNGATYIVEADVARDIARCRRRGPGDQRRRTLSESIAHEIAHSLVRRHLGFRADRRLPSWIKEGYCEYVAQGSVIDPEFGLTLLIRGGGEQVPGFAQFRNRLMMEFLINVRGVTAERIFDDPPTYRETLWALRSALAEDEAVTVERCRAR